MTLKLSKETLKSLSAKDVLPVQGGYDVYYSSAAPLGAAGICGACMSDATNCIDLCYQGSQACPDTVSYADPRATMKRRC